MSEKNAAVKEPKENFFNKLKAKWGIDSDLQIIIILIVFALTGFSAVEFRKVYFSLFGFDKDTHWLLKTMVWIVLLTPTYQVLLIVWGTVFGQFRFFWEKEKKLFHAIARLFKKKDHAS